MAISKPINAALPPLRIVIAGHVDHGKSTLVGRMLHDTGSLPDGKYESIRAMCTRRGVRFEWAFLLDALQAERDQGVTIDTTQIWFHTQNRNYVIIDAPGHKEFLKNMITGAAQADAALLIVDAGEGMQEQSRRHGFLLHMLGVRQFAVAVNKMDAVEYDRARFDATADSVRAYFGELGMLPSAIIPVSAREGDMIASRSTKLAWHDGPTITQALDAFAAPQEPTRQALRFPVQDIYKFDDRRIIAGRIEAGALKVGDLLLFSPANKTAKVRTIESWPRLASPRETAQAGESIGITLDEQIFIERGEIASHEHQPPVESDVFRAHIFWLGREPLRAGQSFKMKLAGQELPIFVQTIEKVIDTGDLSPHAAEEVGRNQVGEIVVRSRRLLALDPFTDCAATGRFVLIADHDIAGGGIISMEGYADQRPARRRISSNITRVAHRVSGQERAHRLGHKGGVLWLTGLSGAGKSTIALTLEQKLFELGMEAYVLDGDNIRHGLNADLGFSPEDRCENIRRIGEVAALFERAGLIAITAFISPYRSDRARARSASRNFHEVHVAADLATCEARDPKGLYRKARAGELREFTGLSAPYEAPEAPELVLNTNADDPQESAAQLLTYVLRHFRPSQ